MARQDMHQSGAVSRPGAGRVCVCVAPAGVELPEALASAMRAKGLDVELVSTPLEAFAQVLARGAGTILLIIEPSRAPWGERVARAAERYAPVSSVWCWEAAASPQLRPLVVPRTDAKAERSGAPAMRPQAAPPRQPNGDAALLRLVDTQNGASQDSSNGQGSSNGRGASGGGMLNADELAMLLGERVRRAEGRGR